MEEDEKLFLADLNGTAPAPNNPLGADIEQVVVHVNDEAPPRGQQAKSEIDEKKGRSRGHQLKKAEKKASKEEARQLWRLKMQFELSSRL